MFYARKISIVVTYVLLIYKWKCNSDSLQISLWSGLCERVSRQMNQNDGEAPECQPIGSKVDCG